MYLEITKLNWYKEKLMGGEQSFLLLVKDGEGHIHRFITDE